LNFWRLLESEKCYSDDENCYRCPNEEEDWERVSAIDSRKKISPGDLSEGSLEPRE
jgi:hypothetical protein